MWKIFVILITLGCIAGSSVAEDYSSPHDRNNLLHDPSGKSLHWKCKNAAVDGNSVTVSGKGEARASLALHKNWKYLTVELEMRLEDVVRDKEGREDAGLAFHFLTAEGKRVGDPPRGIRKTGSCAWQYFYQTYEIPEGAATITFAVGNWGKTGNAFFRNIAVKPAVTEELKGGAPFDEKQLWSFDDAERAVTATRERICLNGLWQFRPAASAVETPPADYTCYFKVPGIWPGFDEWGQPGSAQRIYRKDGSDAGIDGKSIDHAWYRRKILVPENWKGRRILLELSYLQIHAQIFIDGRKAGDLAFPGGEFDLTDFIVPGREQELAVLLSAQTEGLKQLFYSDKDRVHLSDKKIVRRGLTGDAYLRAEPGLRLTDLHVITSVSAQNISFEVGFTGKVPAGAYLETVISEEGRAVKTFRSGPVRVRDGRFRYTANWLAPKLWDTENPDHLYTAATTLKDASGKVLDALYPEEFGFREFTLSGRDFRLNGKIIRLLSTVSLTPWYGAGTSMPVNFKRTAELMRRHGLNHFYAGNYDFSPGDTGYQDAFYRENSRQGILTTLTLPNPVPFKFDTPEEIAAYTERTRYLVRRYQNVPGLILYSSTHNSSGYSGSDEPVMLGTNDVRGAWVVNPRNNEIAREAEKIVRKLDPSRPLYHHSAGISGKIITLNCYLNWMPLQERRDYLELWAAKSKMPLMFVEYGIPHLPSWTSYRGPDFIWSGPQVMSVWINEYIAQYFGDEAYRLDGVQNQFLNMQVEMFGNRKAPLSRYTWMLRSPAAAKLQAMMLRETIPYFRAYGLTGIALWDHYQFWDWQSVPPELRQDRFENLKRTGISADFLQLSPLDFGTAPNLIGEAVREATRPLLGRIAGRTDCFTEQNACFIKGETVRKSLMLLNDTMHPATISCVWEVPALKLKGKADATLAPGERKFVPVEFRLPAKAPEKLVLNAVFTYPDGEETRDSFAFMAEEALAARVTAQLYCHDPEGSAKALLKELKLSCREGQIPPAGSILIIGRNALESYPGDPGKLARSGVKVLIMEQEHAVLWNRLGIRSTEYGMRKLYPLAPEFDGKPLSDWRGESTLKNPYSRRREWCGFPIWGNIQAGYRGALSTAVPEKPCIGDWMPLLEGGFNLSYAPLLLFREGNAVMLFSQLDLSGRTERSPEALELFATALEYLEKAPAQQPRRTFYSGDAAGKRVLDTLKIHSEPLAESGSYGENDLLIIAPGFRQEGCREAVARGANLLALGLDKAAIDALVPGKNGAGVWKDTYSHLPRNLKGEPLFRGISSADLFWRKPLTGAFFDDSDGGPALKCFRHGKGSMVFVQATPWMFDENEFQLRITLRRNYALISRLIHNLGGTAESGLFNAFSSPREFALTDWVGKADPDGKGREKGYWKPSFKLDSSWRKVKVATIFDTEENRLAGYDGDFFYRTAFSLPKLPKEKVTLYLGPVDDCSWVWLNGEFLGEVSDKTHPENHWTVEREYTLPPGLLKKNGNTLVVLCRDLRGNGGILGTPLLLFGDSAYRLYADTPEIQDDPYRYYHW